jgi:hypothetical protein
LFGALALASNSILYQPSSRSSGESPTTSHSTNRRHPDGAVFQAEEGSGADRQRRVPHFSRALCARSGDFQPSQRNGRLGFDPYNHHWRSQLQQLIMG